MREIKFRAWSPENKQMIYPSDFATSLNRNVEVCLRFSNKYTMQYTGLKDKNGKEIYEGDIMRVLYSGFEEIGVIKWSDEYLQWIWERKGFEAELYMLAMFTPFEIIGNIYENPELLEEK